MKNDIKLTISLQLISLIAAVIVWTTIMNIVKPIVTGFVNVTVAVENESVILDQNKAYTIVSPRICKISYKAESSQLKMVRQSDFRAYIDLNDLANGNQDLPIYVEQLNNIDSIVSNVTVEPKTLHVVIDDVSRHEVEMKYELKGDVKKGYSVGEVILSPSVMFASGSEEFLSNIAYVLIEIPLNNQDEAFSGIATPKLISVDGEEMSKEGIILSANEVNYTVMVYTRKTVSLNAILEGKPRAGCTVESAIVYPKNIMIDGPRSVVKDINFIDLPVIDLTDRSESFKVTYKIEDVLPAGIKTISTKTVTVDVKIATTNGNILNKPEGTNEDVGPHVEP